MPEPSPVGALVRRHDHDRYLTALFAPDPARQALFALYAFNVEVAKTREVVREPMLGSIRLQWWREALAEIYGGGPVRRHEVVEPLAEAIHRHELPIEPFSRLIEARELDLAAEPPADLARLTEYAEATSSTLVGLALTVLGAATTEAERVGREVGIAYALTGLIRAIPFHARAKRLYIPRVLLEESRVNIEDLFELRSSPALSLAVRAIADAAAQHLSAARAEPARVGRRGLPALLPASLARLHLRRLARAGYDPFHPGLAELPASAAWRLGLNALRGRF